MVETNDERKTAKPPKDEMKMYRVRRIVSQDYLLGYLT